MIKKISEKDIPECVQVIKDSFLTVANEFNFTEENAARFTAFAINNERLLWQYNEQRPMFGYYTDNGKIVGYFSLEIKDNSECELNNLCVLPAYRHQKTGGLLLEYAFDKAAEMNCTKMSIGIVEENKMLRKWYENYGFKHIGTQKYDFFPFTCGYMEKEL